MLGGTFDPKGQPREMGTRARSPGQRRARGPDWSKFVSFRFRPKWVQNVQKSAAIRFSTFQLAFFRFKGVISILKNLTWIKIANLKKKNDFTEKKVQHARVFF